MRFDFSDFTLDTRRFELRRAGHRVALSPKAFQVLEYLIRHRDRVVMREELFDQCWPGSFVGDAALSTAVRAVRRALGDSRDDGLIQTLHKRGYRFVAEVAEVGASDDGARARDASVSEPRPSQRAPSAAAATDGDPELKTVSVLCCRLEVPVPQASHPDLESGHRVMRSFLMMVDLVLGRCGGVMMYRSEDGFSAVFGAPTAQEDHARRAVRAACELRSWLAQGPSPTTDEAPRPALVVHSGATVVGGLESASEQPFMATNPTLAWARRLLQATAPGELLISPAVRSYVDTDVPCVAREPGLDGIPVYAIPDAPVAATLTQPRRAALPDTPFVGRAQELAGLQEALASARSGRGRIVAVMGEPGLGKSRLVREFVTGLTDVGFHQTHCTPYGSGTPWQAVRELVRGLCGVDAGDPVGRVAAGLVATLAQVGIESPEAPALLLQLMDVPGESGALSGLSPQARRERTLDWLCELVLRPVPGTARVVLWEDLHWIDASSQEWLCRLSRRMARAPVLLVLTFRPEYGTDGLDPDVLTRMDLPALDPFASLALSRALGRKLPKAASHHIAVRAAGNPFFLEELTRAAQAGDSMDAIPGTVEAVLAARIDQLDRRDKHLLQVAALIGEKVAVPLWSRVSGTASAALDAALQRLCERGFLERDSAGQADVCRFRHALTREVARQTLLPRVRRALHARIAQCIEQEADGASSRPELLAGHHAEAGHPAEAAACWLRAARLAGARSALPEAERLARQGLETLQELPERSAHQTLELQLLTALGSAQMAVRGYGSPQVQRTWLRARTLCRRLDETATEFRTLLGSWNYHWVRGELAHAVATARELLSLAQTGSAPADLMRAELALGEVLYHLGHLSEAGSHLEQGVAHHRALTRRSHAAEAAAVAGLCYASWARWQLGAPQRSLDAARQALALARELAHPLSQAIALSLIAELHQLRGEPGSTASLSQEAVALCRLQRFPFWEGTALVLQGWAVGQLGQPEQAQAFIREGLRVFRATGARVQMTAWHTLQADTLLAARRARPGLEAVRKGMAWVGRTGECHEESELHRLRACLLALDGQTDAAVQACARARDMARARGERPRERRAEVDLARLSQPSGAQRESA